MTMDGSYSKDQDPRHGEDRGDRGSQPRRRSVGSSDRLERAWSIMKAADGGRIVTLQMREAFARPGSRRRGIQ